MPVTCRKIGNKFRIFGPNGKIEKTKKGNAVDGGGHSTGKACGLQARAINANVENAKHIRRTRIVPSNPLLADPTRTKTLRDKFTREITKRFRGIKSAVLKLLVVEDAFGLKRENQTRNEEIENANDNGKRIPIDRRFNSVRSKSGRYVSSENDTNNPNGNRERGLRNTTTESRNGLGGIRGITINQRFAFQSDSDKIESFRKWLQTQFSLIVPLAAGENLENQFFTQFVEEGFRKGAGRAFDDTNRARRVLATTPEELSFFGGTKEEFLRQSFGQPETIEKIKLLTSRVFTELKGVTEAMAQSLTRELAQGLARGENPLTIAREINKNIEKIGIRRARVIARTEIIRSHAEGQLDALEAMGVEEVGVAVEWSTAGDDRVCPLCQPLDGVVMPIKEARGIIPRHPLCRCSFVPENVGESKKGQKRSKTQVKGAFDKSIKAEIPKKSSRTIAQQKKLSKWEGADTKIAKERPVSILGTPKEKLLPKPPPAIVEAPAPPVKGFPRPVKPREVTPKRKPRPTPKVKKPITKPKPPTKITEPIKPKKPTGPPSQISFSGQQTKEAQEVWDKIGGGIKTESQARNVGSILRKRVQNNPALKKLESEAKEITKELKQLKSKIFNKPAASTKDKDRWSELLTKRRDLKPKLSRAKTNAVTEELNKVRDFGKVKLDLKGVKEFESTIQDASKNLPTDWLNNIKDKTSIKLEKSKRGFFNDGITGKVKQQTSLAIRSSKDIGVAAHELTHAAEQATKLAAKKGATSMGDLQKQFVKRRAKGETKSSIYKGSKELGFKNEFKEHYMGKIIEHGDHAEVLSLAVEDLFHGRELLDNETMDFALGLLAGF